MEAANAKAELAKVQAMRLEELGFAEQAREEDPGGASNPLATIKALRTIALWEGENMADALRNRMELLGLSKEERAQRDKLMARKNNDEDSDEVPADAASIPISRKMQRGGQADAAEGERHGWGRRRRHGSRAVPAGF